MNPILHTALLVGTVVAIASGQVLFKLAATGWTPGTGVTGLLQVPWFWIGLGVYGGATVAWLLLLRMTPLSVAYPFFALAFVVVPVLSWWLLGEPLNWRQGMGAVLIVAGVWTAGR